MLYLNVSFQMLIEVPILILIMASLNRASRVRVIP